MALFGNWAAIALGSLNGNFLRLGSQNTGTGIEGTITEGVLLAYVLANIPNNDQTPEEIRDALISLAGTSRLPASAVSGLSSGSNVFVEDIASLPPVGSDGVTYIVMDDGSGNADLRYWDSNTSLYVDPTEEGGVDEVVSVDDIASLPATGVLETVYLVADADGLGNPGIRTWDGSAYTDAIYVPPGSAVLQFTVDTPAAIGDASIVVGRWGASGSATVSLTGDATSGYVAVIPLGVKVDWIDFHGDSDTSNSSGAAVITIDNSANGYPLTFVSEYWNKGASPWQKVPDQLLGIIPTELRSSNSVKTTYPNVAGNFPGGLLIKMR